MARVDLHTHSLASPDGSLDAAAYGQMLASGKLDIIAVTDHDTISFAQDLAAKLGPQIIVGEEITSNQGEIIGLFLQQPVPPGLSASQTVQHIHEQGGLVYIPHPFETVRKGISREVLDMIADQVDIIETHNGRAVFQNRGQEAVAWAHAHQVAQAASSDAHGWQGWGRTYSDLAEIPTSDTLRGLLAQAQHSKKTVGMRGVLYPKYNRMRRRTGRGGQS
jgi:predicted metal-dependent phosphoesterase TrpH